MNKHLKLVREFHDTLLFPQAESGKTLPLSDMEIIWYQALLMEAGSEVLKAVKVGEITEILGGLVDLAYVALAAIAKQGGEVFDHEIPWEHDWFVLPVIKDVSNKINCCTSGEIDKYSEIYYLCSYLAKVFVNADFDKAFQVIHDHNISRIKMSSESIYDDIDNIRKLKLQKMPDLSGCLYE